MLKWSPEPFDVATAEEASPVANADDFQSTVVGETDSVASTNAREFRREAGFADTKALMNALTQEERAQVYELVEIDLAEEYQAREAEQAAAFATQLQETEAETAQMMSAWCERIAGAMASELHDAAAASARLAVQMAEKIVRQAVAADPETLARVVETTLFKIADSAPLTIRTSPADAAWLESQPSLQEHLNIAHIVADRRVESGGCVILSDGREWDATLSRQLNTLEEIVTESINTAVVDPTVLEQASATESQSEESPKSESEVDDVPGVE